MTTISTIDYYIVLDFEATCEIKDISLQEIIEFPSIIYNASTYEIEDQIQLYIKPIFNPKLTEFCIDLTGIQQEWVDGAETFENAYNNYITWLKSHKFLNFSQPNFTFVTCGDWDLKTMFPKQMRLSKLGDPPAFFNTFVNIKVAFANRTGARQKGMMGMLKSLNLVHEGRHHSGIDDCKNIGNILIELLKRGPVKNTTINRKRV